MLMDTLKAMFLGFFVLCAQPAVAEPRIMATHFNPVTRPDNLADALLACREESNCKAATDAIAAYYGVPPQAMEQIDHTVSMFRTGGGSEETRILVEPPNGYRICRVTVRLKSINPPAGDKSAHLSVTAARDRFQIYTWVPSGGWLDGMRWVEGTVYSVVVPRSEYSAAREAGTCNLYAERLKHFTCRGAASHHNGAHGWPACPGRFEVSKSCDGIVCNRWNP